MPLHPLTAAKCVCLLRDWRATNLEINKVLYLAQMVWLGRNPSGLPLINEEFEAWDYGPVLPTVYHRAKAFGDQPVLDVFHAFPNLNKGPAFEIIKEAVDTTKDMRPGDLVAVTHWRQGAWAKCYRPGVRGIKIPNAVILQEYMDRV